MGRFFTVILFFPILLILVLILSVTTYVRDTQSEMAEIRVSFAANSASDAAMQLALEISHIDIYGKHTIDVDIIWEEYKRTFLRAIGMYSERNMRELEAYFPAAVLAVNDGYFIRMRTTKTVGGREIVEYVWSQKIPYARVWEDPAFGGEYVVADTMNGRYIYGVGPINSIELAPRVWGDFEAVNCSARAGRLIRGIRYPAVQPGLERLHDTSLIGRELVLATNYLVEVENSVLTGSPWAKNRFYVPRSLVDELYYDAVEFFGLSLIVLVQNFDMISSTPVDYYTVSNTQIIAGSMVALFQGTGCATGAGIIGCYHPADAPVRFSMSGGVARLTHTNPTEYVTSEIEAARRGYYPCPRYYRIN